MEVYSFAFDGLEAGTTVRKTAHGVGVRILHAWLADEVAKAGSVHKWKGKKSRSDFDCFGLLPDGIIAMIGLFVRDVRTFGNFSAASKRIKDLKFLRDRRRTTNILFDDDQYELFVSRFMGHRLSPWMDSDNVTLDISMFREMMVEFYITMFAVPSVGAEYRKSDDKPDRVLATKMYVGSNDLGEFRLWGDWVPAFQVRTLKVVLRSHMKCFPTLCFGFQRLTRLVLDDTPVDNGLMTTFFWTVLERGVPHAYVPESSRSILPSLEHFQWTSSSLTKRLIPRQVFIVLQWLTRGRVKPLKSVCLDGHTMGYKLHGFFGDRDPDVARLELQHYKIRHISLRSNGLKSTRSCDQLDELVKYFYRDCMRQVLEYRVRVQNNPNAPQELSQTAEFADGPLTVYVYEKFFRNNLYPMTPASGQAIVQETVERVLSGYRERGGEELRKLVRFQWDQEGVTEWCKYLGRSGIDAQ